VKPSVFWVVVLGDFGRSPRMQYHTLSISSKPNTLVYVLAYAGAAPLQAITSAPNVHIVHIPDFKSRLPRLLHLILKVLTLGFALLWFMLARLPRPKCILVQTPPAIPIMAIAYLSSKLHSSGLVFDWHNYGYTILSLSSGTNSPLVKVARAYESFWSRRSTAAFCVTKAMRDDMAERWGVSPTVLYDRPPAQFQPTSPQGCHRLFTSLYPSLCHPDFHDFLTDRLHAMGAPIGIGS
jgi:beta-1,4-mannosyltransferase